MKLIGAIPQLGFGTFTHEGDEGRKIIGWALETGYRHIDTAQMYRNEAQVGQAVAESGIPRGELFITTKIGPENFGPGKIMGHAKASLDKLQVDKVDLLLLHWPSTTYDVNDYTAQLAAVYDAGLAKHIGVSNFTKELLDVAIRVFGSRLVATNQCEIHVFNQNSIIAEYCKSKNIPMTAYSPLARGAVSKNAVLQNIATKHGCTAGQVSLAFLMQEGHIVIPASTNKARMKENFESQNVVLTTEDMTTIRQLDEGHRLVTGSWAPKWDK